MVGAYETFQATPTTIGRMLAGDALAVPRFQREYAWGPDEVDKLLRDFSRAKRAGPQAYFLGSVVLSSGAPLEVIDGQQRLATSSIILAVIRDKLLGLQREPQADSIEQQFLRQTEFEGGRISPRLTLNVDDRAYFWQAIICRPESEERQTANPRFESHRKLSEARDQISNWIGGEIDRAADSADRIEMLGQWRAFLHDHAIIASLIARDRRQAFRMFVTLNDRGLQVSQTDLVKNHLFERAQNSFDVVQSAWTQVRSSLEALDLEGVSLDYLRHFLAMRRGLVREEEIFDVVEDTVVTERDAVQFSEQLALRANDYTAVLAPTHSRWRSVQQGTQICKRLQVLNDVLKVKVHRALLLAIVSCFDDREIAAALQWVTSLAVRLIVVGGARSGRTEEGIANAAKKIADGEVTTAGELSAELSSIAPGDTVFQEEFAEKRIDKPRVARYLLRSIEGLWRQEAFPETTVVDDPNVVNLEHVLPKKYPQDAPEWSHFSEDEHRAYASRIGNMVLMRANDNSTLGQAGFSEKRAALSVSVNLLTTKDIVDNTSENALWQKENIEARQSRLARSVVEVWPVNGF